MAVKVMFAPAVAQKRDAAAAAEKKPRGEAGEAKPKRRRSSVYDADGNEVFITLMCLKCHKNSGGVVDSSVAGDSPVPEAPFADKVVDPGTLAAQVVAALHGGRR